MMGNIDVRPTCMQTVRLAEFGLKIFQTLSKNKYSSLLHDGLAINENFLGIFFSRDVKRKHKFS